MMSTMVAAMLVEMFAQCGKFDFTLANTVREAERRAGATGQSSGSSHCMKGSNGGEDDSSSDEEDQGGAATPPAFGATVGGGGGKVQVEKLLLDARVDEEEYLIGKAFL